MPVNIFISASMSSSTIEIKSFFTNARPPFAKVLNILPGTYCFDGSHYALFSQRICIFVGVGHTGINL